jgi:hypothetical protein
MRRADRWVSRAARSIVRSWSNPHRAAAFRMAARTRRVNLFPGLIWLNVTPRMAIMVAGLSTIPLRWCRCRWQDQHDEPLQCARSRLIRSLRCRNQQATDSIRSFRKWAIPLLDTRLASADAASDHRIESQSRQSVKTYMDTFREGILSAPITRAPWFPVRVTESRQTGLRPVQPSGSGSGMSHRGRKGTFQQRRGTGLRFGHHGEWR